MAALTAARPVLPQSELLPSRSELLPSRSKLLRVVDTITGLARLGTSSVRREPLPMTTVQPACIGRRLPAC